MKKIAVAAVLALLLQIMPNKLFASVPPAQTSSIVAVAAVAGFILLLDNGGSKPSAKATGNEFDDLNNNPAYKSLLNQAAGGSLNTLDIVK